MKSGFLRALGISVLILAALVGLLNWDKLASIVTGDVDRSNQTLLMYCAAGIRKPVEAVAREYEQRYGVKIELDFAGSGTLLSKIRAAHGGDIYLAADITYMDTAREYELIEEVIPLASQHVVIAVSKDNPKGIRGLDDLLREDVRVSLGDPQAAAISKVTKKLLSGSKKFSWDRLWQAKTIARQTVNEIANDIKIGAADAGIVWDATAGQYPELEAVMVDVFQQHPKQIALAILRGTSAPSRALHFARYLSARDRGLSHFDRFGYDAVKGDKWAEKPEIKVFAGGLNRPAIQDTIRQFEQREGVTVLDSYNGCGILVGQIKIGSVPDMYFACDISFMTQVDVYFPSPQDISSTEMVIVVARDNPHHIQHLKDLTKQDLKVGLCHSQKSALGALTKRLLEKHGLWDAVYKNVKDTPATADRLIEHVVFGSLEAVVAYRANTILQQDKLTVLAIDDPLANAVQPIAVSTQSQFPYLTARLVRSIRSAQSREKFQQLGFRWLGEPSAP